MGRLGFTAAAFAALLSVAGGAPGVAEAAKGGNGNGGGNGGGKPGGGSTIPESPCDETVPVLAPDADGWRRLTGAELCLTLGKLSEPSQAVFFTNSGAMRAHATSSESEDAQLSFTYQGKSRKDDPLASGLVRRQIGLRLRAQDSCNVISVMWVIDPDPRILIETKYNPGQTTNAECGTNGYTRVAEIPIPAAEVGSFHELRARMDGQNLDVWADGTSVFGEPLGAEVLDMQGPPGVRTDNVSATFEFEVR